MTDRAPPGAGSGHGRLPRGAAAPEAAGPIDRALLRVRRDQPHPRHRERLPRGRLRGGGRRDPRPPTGRSRTGCEIVRPEALLSDPDPRPAAAAGAVVGGGSAGGGHAAACRGGSGWPAAGGATAAGRCSRRRSCWRPMLPAGRTCSSSTRRTSSSPRSALETFVAADGRARSRRVRLSAGRRKWMQASFRALGLAAPRDRREPADGDAGGGGARG